MMSHKLICSMFGGSIVLIGIGIAMGILFPAGRDPFVPKSYALAMCGRNLYYTIEQNKEQQGIEGKWVDPQKCSNSVDFITGVLSASRTNGQEWRSIDKGVALWNVAIDAPVNCGGLFPMLISANFNPRLLERSIDDDAQLPIGRASGATLSLLDDKAVILIRKNGSSQVIRAKYCTRRNILMTSCKSNSSVTYLTPARKITINLTTESAIIPHRNSSHEANAQHDAQPSDEREERRALHAARRHCE